LNNKQTIMSKQCQNKQINQFVSSFFSCFDNRSNKAPNFDELKDMFLPTAIICKRTGLSIEEMSVEQFIAPRKELLTNGCLVNFHEWEIEHQSFIQGGIASRICRYAKEGLFNGKPYEGEGNKHIQLVLSCDGWKISSILWEDDEEV